MLLALLITLAFGNGFCATIIVQNCSVIPGSTPVPVGQNFSGGNIGDPLGCISFGSGESLTSAAQKCDGDSNGYPGSFSLRELVAILPYLYTIQPPAGDYIIDTIDSFTDGWISLLDGNMNTFNPVSNNILGFSSNSCLDGDSLVWSLPVNYTRNKKNGTLKCSSDPDLPRKSFCLRYFRNLKVYTFDTVNGSYPLSKYQVIVNNKKFSSEDKAWILLPKQQARIRMEKSGYLSAANYFQFSRYYYGSQRDFQVSFQTHQIQRSDGLRFSSYGRDSILSVIEANGTKSCTMNLTNPVCSRIMMVNTWYQEIDAIISDSAGYTYAFYIYQNTTQAGQNSYGNAYFYTGFQSESFYYDYIASIGKKYWILGCFNGDTRSFVPINKYQTSNPASTIVATCKTYLS